MDINLWLLIWVNHRECRKYANAYAVPTRHAEWLSALTCGTHAKHSSSPISSVTRVVGRGAPPSSSIASWATSDTLWKDAVNVSSIAYSDVPCTLSDVAMAYIIVCKLLNWPAILASRATLISPRMLSLLPTKSSKL